MPNMGEPAQRSDAGKPGIVEPVAPSQAAEGAALEGDADKAWQKVLVALRETVQAEQSQRLALCRAEHFDTASYSNFAQPQTACFRASSCIFCSICLYFGGLPEAKIPQYH